MGHGLNAFFGECNVNGKKEKNIQVFKCNIR